MKKYKRWQERKFSKWGRVSLIIIFPVIFIGFFVLAPGWLAYQRYELPLGLAVSTGQILGGAIFLFGFTLYLWTIILFAKVEGTQVPIAPTQQLVTSGPYAVSRNPMVTATIIMVAGTGIFLNSESFIIAGCIIPSLYLIYIKLIEEKELEHRFGDAYRNYRKITPFILPRLF